MECQADQGSMATLSVDEGDWGPFSISPLHETGPAHTVLVFSSGWLPTRPQVTAWKACCLPVQFSSTLACCCSCSCLSRLYWNCSCCILRHAALSRSSPQRSTAGWLGHSREHCHQDKLETPSRSWFESQKSNSRLFLSCCLCSLKFWTFLASRRVRSASSSSIWATQIATVPGWYLGWWIGYGEGPTGETAYSAQPLLLKGPSGLSYHTPRLQAAPRAELPCLSPLRSLLFPLAGLQPWAFYHKLPSCLLPYSFLKFSSSTWLFRASRSTWSQRNRLNHVGAQQGLECSNTDCSEFICLKNPPIGSTVSTG